MFLINFQLWARNGKIPGGGNFNIRGGFNISGKRLLTARAVPGERSLLLKGPVLEFPCGCSARAEYVCWVWVLVVLGYRIRVWEVRV